MMPKNLLTSCLLILLVPGILWAAETSDAVGAEDAESPCACVNVAYHATCPCFRCPRCGRVHRRVGPAEAAETPEAPGALEAPSVDDTRVEDEGVPTFEETYPQPTGTAAAAPASVTIDSLRVISGRVSASSVFTRLRGSVKSVFIERCGHCLTHEKQVMHSR